jgi:regulator of G-protein signaling
LEGLKRAQRSRLEDQRGTEINFELPDFLKDKENNIQNNKLRKLKENVSTTAMHGTEPIPYARSIIDESMMTSLTSLSEPSVAKTTNNLSVPVRPQPAPRLSITAKSNSNLYQHQPTSLNSAPIRNEIPKSLESHHSQQNVDFKNEHINSNLDDQSSSNSSSFNSDNKMESSFHSLETVTYEDEYVSAPAGSFYEDDFVLCNDGNGSEHNGYVSVNLRGPPPLPPKPKILPIKPSNWGQNNIGNNDVFKIPQEMPRRLITNNTNHSTNNNMDTNNSGKPERTVYLDQPSSSFV